MNCLKNSNAIESWEQWGDYEDDELFFDRVEEDSFSNYDVCVEDKRRYVGEPIKSSLAPRPISIYRLKSDVLEDSYEDEDEDEENKKELEEYKSVMKTKLNWLSEPVVDESYDSGYDSDDDEKLSKVTFIKQSISEEDYPSLSSNIFKQKKKVEPKVVVKEKPIQEDEEDKEEGWKKIIHPKNKKDVQTNECTKMCSSWTEGQKCSRKKCTYAHSENELKIIECPFKNCNMVFEKEGCFFNKNSEKICNKNHHNETRNNVLERIGVFKPKMERSNQLIGIPDELVYALSLLSSDKFIEFEGVKYFGKISTSSKVEDPKKKEKTQMCRSVKDKTKCPHGINCRYAHKFEELVVSLCGFNDKCRGIQKNEKGYYTNSNEEKICFYRHTTESKDNYRRRTRI